MSVGPLEAAKHACAASGWTLTNLQLQKILYIAHMLYLGRTGQRLIDGELFEAWDYGPVLPSVYRKVSSFGSGKIRDGFWAVDDLDEDFWDADEAKEISKAVAKLKDVSPFKLVDIVHDDRSAWAQVYSPYSRSAVIEDDLIADEYRKRFPKKK